MQEEPPTKAKKRELKKRPRMPVHGRALKLPAKYGGGRLAKIKR